MKKKILNNFPLKILSVVCAMILWMVVMNISDYMITVRIDDIPVEQLNGDVLEELDQVYDVEKGDTIDIVVKGRRSVVSNLTASDFKATADLSTMSITNTVQIFVEPVDKTLEDDITITCVDNTMRLTLEDKVSVQFPVHVEIRGEAKDGYAVCETSSSPNIITVEGPKSAVDKITEVSAVVNVDGKREEFDATGDVVLYDAYGEKFVSDKISVHHNTVNVNVKIYPEKTVPVNIEVKGKPEDGYAVGEVQYQPQNVKIAGPKEALDKITQIDIDDISVSGQNEDLQTTIDLSNYLPESVIVSDSNAEILVNITIEKMITRTLAISEKDISIENKQDGYTYSLIMSDDCSIEVSGLSHLIREVDIDVIAPSVDCSGLTAGEHSVTLKFKDVDGLEYKLKGSVIINVEAK